MMQDLMVATYRFPNSNPYDNHLYMNNGGGRASRMKSRIGPMSSTNCIVWVN